MGDSTVDEPAHVEFELEDIEEGGAVGVIVSFVPTRTRLHKLELVHAERVVGESSSEQAIGAGALEVAIHWGEVLRESARLRIDFSGAPPRLARSEWISPPPPGHAEAVVRSVRPATTAYDVFRTRRARLGRDLQDPAKLRQRQFFYEIDFQTYGDVAASAPSLPSAVGQARTQKIEHLRNYLQSRVQRRAMALLGSLENPLPAHSVYTDRDNLRQVSALLRSMAERYFTVNGVLDMVALEEAFEQFAGARLRDGGVDGKASYYEPDSGLYFSFSEFAFVAVECGVDVCFWGRLVRAMVRSLEIFLRSYLNNTVVSTFLIASRIRPGPETREITNEELAEIRERYQPYTLGQLLRASSYLAYWAMRETRFTDQEVPAFRDWVSA